MPYSNRDFSKDKLPSKKKILVVLFLFVVAFVLAFYFQLERERKLENTKEAIAIVVSVGKTTTGGASVKYTIGKRKISTTISAGDFKFLHSGDSILIKYSLEDPELIEVVDKYYMKKYKH